jgi:hypothetical protein
MNIDEKIIKYLKESKSVTVEELDKIMKNIKVKDLKSLNQKELHKILVDIINNWAHVRSRIPFA